MTYIPDIPLAEISPANQVDQIRTNFARFNDIFSSTAGLLKLNHSAFNTSKQGNHETIILQSQDNDSINTLDIASLYCKNVTSFIDTQPQLFARIPKFLANNVNNFPMQLTYNKVNTTGPVYQSFLPGGYILYFGSTNTPTIPIVLTPTPQSILMGMANPNQTKTTSGRQFSIPFTISLTQPVAGNSFVASITINISPITTPCTWFAIGKA